MSFSHDGLNVVSLMGVRGIAEAFDQLGATPDKSKNIEDKNFRSDAFFDIGGNSFNAMKPDHKRKQKTKTAFESEVDKEQLVQKMQGMEKKISEYQQLIVKSEINLEAESEENEKLRKRCCTLASQLKKRVADKDVDLENEISHLKKDIKCREKKNKILQAQIRDSGPIKSSDSSGHTESTKLILKKMMSNELKQKNLIAGLAEAKESQSKKLMSIIGKQKKQMKDVTRKLSETEQNQKNLHMKVLERDSEIQTLKKKLDSSSAYNQQLPSLSTLSDDFTSLPDTTAFRALSKELSKQLSIIKGKNRVIQTLENAVKKLKDKCKSAERVLASVENDKNNQTNLIKKLNHQMNIIKDNVPKERKRLLNEMHCLQERVRNSESGMQRLTEEQQKRQQQHITSNGMNLHGVISTLDAMKRAQEQTLSALRTMEDGMATTATSSIDTIKRNMHDSTLRLVEGGMTATVKSIDAIKKNMLQSVMLEKSSNRDAALIGNVSKNMSPSAQEKENVANQFHRKVVKSDAGALDSAHSRFSKCSDESTGINSVETEEPKWQQEVRHVRGKNHSTVKRTIDTKNTDRSQSNGSSILRDNSNASRRKIKPPHRKVKFIDSFDADCTDDKSSGSSLTHTYTSLTTVGSNNSWDTFYSSQSSETENII